jgi:hypothetical protein
MRGTRQPLRSWFGQVARLAVAAMMPLTLISASADPANEYHVKAAFLFNFPQFVEWPASAFRKSDLEFRIGILGDDPFGSVLEETIRGEKVHDRKMTVQRSSQLDALKNCQILFISKSEKSRLNEILTALSQEAVVTVSEVDGFARRGGVINFFLESGKVRFEINPAAARRKGLKMSSQLLKLGKIVESAKEEK